MSGSCKPVRSCVREVFDAQAVLRVARTRFLARRVRAPAGSAASAAANAGSANPGAGSAGARQEVQLTAPCVELGQHLAEVLIQTADPAQRTVFENDRDRIVKASAEACTVQNWSGDAINCF